MQTATCSTTVGVFQDKAQADRAVDALFDAGFNTNQIGVVTRDLPTHRSTARPDAVQNADAGDNATAGATAGVVTGAGIGALVGWGVLAGAIPVVGPALFAGTLGVLATNAAGGAAAVGILGALTGWGVSEDQARHYESEIAAGRIVVTVTSDRCESAKAILMQHGAATNDAACCN